jgi:pimeloyl-ACP methyl ester carboxylesterase
MTRRLRTARSALQILLVFAALLAVASGAQAATAKPGWIPELKWSDCADGFECATAAVPLDYDKREGKKIELAVTRLRAQDPARRIGSLFVNYGGPGGDAVATTQAIGKDLFGALNDRFDIVAFDPRGVGESKPSIDCAVNQETDGVYGQPFVTPENLAVDAVVARAQRYIKRCLDLNPGILPFVSTANVARDMDLLREAVGDAKLSYLGFSYGTFLGATYESMFPDHVGALVLDGALDADVYINRPLEALREQSSGFERALGRFFQACASTKDVCPFGGDDPWSAFDELVQRADASPIPAGGLHPAPVDGNDLLSASILAMYAKQFWPLLAAALTQAEAGDGTLARELVDFSYGRLEDGTYDPATDRYFTIGALEQRYPPDVQTYLEAGRHSWGLFDHFWWNSGYVELTWGLYPVEPKGVFYGPFDAPGSAPTTLVIGTTYDPATPYRGAKRLVADLGNARLLTMRGDGHTAFGGNSPCIDAAVEAYLEEGALPAPGTVCRQEVPFVAPEPDPAEADGASLLALRMKARSVW